MIEFTRPVMYALDDTLTKPGYGADAKAVGDALAQVEQPDLSAYATQDDIKNLATKDEISEAVANVDCGIKEAPTANLWELEPGIYTMSYGFQWGQYEKPINRRYTPITEGICIIGQRTNDIYNKVYTILADNRIYYGNVSKMTATNVETGELMDVIEGTMDYIEKTDKIDDVTTAKFGVPSSEAVKKYVDAAIEGIEIPDVSKFISEIPEEYITETELNDKGYLTEHQSLTDYAKKEDIPDVSKFITEIPEEYVTDSELTAKGYLTEHQSLDGKADKDHTHSEYLTEHQSLEGYAKTSDIPDVSKFITEIPEEYITETELNDKGYLTEHQSLEGYAKTADIPDVSVYQTEAQVLALIENNLPPSAEEVSY